jgi:hypothetical protein
MSLSSTNSFGPLTTDLCRQAAGLSSLPLIVHGCKSCGYAGTESSFRPVSTVPEVYEWVKASLGPRSDGFPAGAKFENAARIAELLGTQPYEAANLWLHAGWCSSSDSPAGKRYRCEAVVRFEAAMDADQVPPKDRAAVTYLIGELHRRTGNGDKANAWFARVPDAVGTDSKQQWLVDLAIQQSTDPKEYVDEERGAAGKRG